MKLSQLKYFISICTNNSVTAAASSLYISQPTLSVAIKELEKELGVSLFLRPKKKLILTEEGKYFLKEATEIVNRADALENTMKDVSKSSRKLRIGTPPMAAVFLFPELANIFNERYPLIRIELVETGTHELEQLIQEGAIDAAITNCQTFSDLYQHMPIVGTELLGCVNKNHPLANRTGVTMSMLENEKLILNSPTSMTTKHVLQAFEDENTKLNLFMWSHQLYLIFHLVQQYGLVSFLVDELLHANTDIATFSLEKPIRLTYSLIRKNNVRPSTDMMNFLHCCESYAGKHIQSRN